MAKLVRYQQCGCLHFVTFSCYRRQPLPDTPMAYSLFEAAFEAVRRRYGFVVAGYVLMPEHAHLLLGEPRRSTLSIALQVLKQQTPHKLKKRGEVQLWQRRYYDFNVWSEEKRVEKLRCMHRNPVARDVLSHPSLERREGWGIHFTGRERVQHPPPTGIRHNLGLVVLRRKGRPGWFAWPPSGASRATSDRRAPGCFQLRPVEAERSGRYWSTLNNC